MAKFETLWRPVGRNELQLIKDADYRAFPPRLAIQPIFYPVLNFEYAEQIARDWNSKDERHGFIGFVTEFDVSLGLLAGYEPQQVGDQVHRELCAGRGVGPVQRRHRRSDTRSRRVSAWRARGLSRG